MFTLCQAPSASNSEPLLTEAGSTLIAAIIAGAIAFWAMRHTAVVTRYRAYLESFKLAKELGITEPDDESRMREIWRLQSRHAKERIHEVGWLDMTFWGLMAYAVFNADVQGSALMTFVKWPVGLFALMMTLAQLPKIVRRWKEF